MKLKIALLQTNPSWEAPRRNLADAAARIARADAALAVLPEMFPTGFTMNPAAWAEEMEGETVRWMRRTAAESGKALMGSIPVREAGPGARGGGNETAVKYYNRLLFAAPDGRLLQYDKKHLFRVAGESDNYTPGDARIVIDYGGFRIFPVVCYDLRFPVWCRNRGDYDLLVDVACWPASRRTVWTTLLSARAIENVAYVAGVNRVGSDPLVSYRGDSGIYDFCGRKLAVASGNRPQTVTAELDMDRLLEFRAKFPVHLDADPFEFV